MIRWIINDSEIKFIIFNVSLAHESYFYCVITRTFRIWKENPDRFVCMKFCKWRKTLFINFWDVISDTISSVYYLCHLELANSYNHIRQRIRKDWRVKDNSEGDFSLSLRSHRTIKRLNINDHCLVNFIVRVDKEIKLILYSDPAWKGVTVISDSLNGRTFRVWHQKGKGFGISNIDCSCKICIIIKSRFLIDYFDIHWFILGIGLGCIFKEYQLYCNSLINICEIWCLKFQNIISIDILICEKWPTFNSINSTSRSQYIWINRVRIIAWIRNNNWVKLIYCSDLIWDPSVGIV